MKESVNVDDDIENCVDDNTDDKKNETIDDNLDTEWQNPPLSCPGASLSD